MNDHDKLLERFMLVMGAAFKSPDAKDSGGYPVLGFEGYEDWKERQIVKLEELAADCDEADRSVLSERCRERIERFREGATPGRARPVTTASWLKDGVPITQWRVQRLFWGGNLMRSFGLADAIICAWVLYSILVRFGFGA